MRSRRAVPIKKMYDILMDEYGDLSWTDWWPAESPFERVVGAILTQQTRWENVDKALAVLKKKGLMDPEKLSSVSTDVLEDIIRPVGFYRQKARYLKAVAEYFSRRNVEPVREALLSLPGIGNETADVILLYVAGRPRFVVDAYAKRILACMGIGGSYDEYQALFAEALGDDVEAFRRYHAFMVEHGKRRCNRMRCDGCVVKKYLG